MNDRTLLSQNAQGEYRLTGVLDLDTVAGYKERGLLVLGQEKDLVSFDLSEAEVKGSAAIALLIAWQREAERMNKRVKFINCPNTLLAIAEACGVSKILECGDKHGS